MGVDTFGDTFGARYPKKEPVLTVVGDTLGYVGYLIPGPGSCAHVGACAYIRAA